MQTATKSRVSTPETIGDRIAEVRSDRKLTQAGLRELLNNHIARLVAAGVEGYPEKGYTRAALSQWENNGTKPNYETIKALGTVLKVSPAYIAFGIGASDDVERSALAPYQGITMVPEIRVGSGPTEREVVRQWGIPTDLLARVTEGEPEDLSLIEINTKALSPDYEIGDRVYLDTSDLLPNGGVFAYWNGVGVSFAYLQMVPGKEPRVQFRGQSVDLDPVPLDEITIIGRVKGRMSLA